MTIRLLGHFDGKVIIPHEPVDLPQDQTLVLHVEPEGKKADVPSATDWLIDNAVDDPSLPKDGARQHDHYLYGTPKK
jgi:hypothetical protein